MPSTEGGGEEGPERPTLQLSGTMAEGEEEAILSFNIPATKCASLHKRNNKEVS